MLTRERLTEWGLANGFVQAGPNAIEAPVGDAKVRLEFLVHSVRVGWVHPKFSGRILTADLRNPNLDFDEHGVPEGIGLGMSMVARFTGDANIPPWFPQAYRDLLAKDTLVPSPSFP